MSEIPQRIEAALDDLPPSVLSRSGSVFYSGREAFQSEQPIYILGLNPGGNPDQQAGNTVAKHIHEFRDRGNRWSAYLDDSWEGAKPGTRGMQPRVLHMLRKLNLDPQLVPASNVVFVRTPNEAALKKEKSELLGLCWPVHRAVIDELGVRIVLCFGGTAGAWVREKVGAKLRVDSYSETNNRGWTSEAHQAPDGLTVLTLSHPSKAKWQTPEADPSPMVQRAVDKLRAERP